MSERDPEPRAQGASPYDEPTETFRVPRDLADGGGASREGATDDSGVAGYQPYRRDATEDSDATVATPAATPAATSDRDTAPPTTAIDRDAFHREHNRRAAYADTDDARTTAYSQSDLGEDELTRDDLARDGHDRDVLDDRDADDRTERIAADDAPASRRGLRGRTKRDRARFDEDELAAAQAAARRGTTDLGLLALRVAVGLIAMAHGAQKLFGWWNGPRLSGFEAFLANNPNPDIGFRGDATKPLAIIGALSETLGGLMLVIGLLTPIAGAAVLGVMIIAATYKATLAGGVWFFASGQAGPGIEYEVFLGIAAAAIILTGPGRISLDFGRGWATRPFVGSVAWLVIGIAAPVAIWILLNGTNPFQSPGNPTSN
ncbi:DoxX family membrane protein [Williamsia deligens]|uniref:DoxX family membrane protein n=1 Tax=Williamsia deligens TaxID=321325 RepID=A0ABW3G5A4_9NOCA|nr:DoxX family membrane protein [Williamsia deligens]MCP2195054.1 putative oxidoreductase [Williamsia deligens]